MKESFPLPIVAITMGDPVGIGPEILIKALCDPVLYSLCRPLMIGDITALETVAGILGSDMKFNVINTPEEAGFKQGIPDVMALSTLDRTLLVPGRPSSATGRAMLRYIDTGVDLAMERRIDALVTGPITKTAMKMAGSAFSGHTELIASRTGAKSHAMMLAGDRLKVILVTIHIPLSSVPKQLTTSRVLETIRIAGQALTQRFGINSARIAVAGLNPHAGESGLFGSEEEEIIAPAISRARALNINATGPLPPDTVFFAAVNENRFDAVVCMYHDQGLIPFKLIHFKDGVNTTLGLPIIRTSVDHGTAYDIAFKGIADHSSLMAAIRMAAFQAACKEAAS